ncbi:hypothetical protein CSUB01_11207 [Colletotrichum sublineola]|uniref:Uncharacterized protein n=1 Tax=Colletotrichum sublineola TaxID=1173701 RepID=A0A066XGH8_COLSU|nr:hypothetical protein CSUB01_11207 [Colletotrichum sublineola]
MFRDSRSRSSSASSGHEESPPDYHAIPFTIVLPPRIDGDANETYERREQDGEEKRGRQRRRRRRRCDSQGLNLCFHSDWVPMRGTLELHFSSEGIQTSLEGQQPPAHDEDARVLTLECSRITFPTANSSSSSRFRLHTWALIGLGLYLVAITLITITVETYIYYNRSALWSMEQRWREIPLSAGLSRVAVLYGDAALSLVELTESAASLLSDLQENILPLCRHAGAITHSIESVCGEYDAVLTDAVASLAALQIHASSWIVAGAMDGLRVKGLLSCWEEINWEDEGDDDDNSGGGGGGSGDGGDKYARGAMYACVAGLLRRWGDTDSAGLLSLAVEQARRMESQLRDMRARQDWIVDPFEEVLRSAPASSSSKVTKKRTVPHMVSVLVSALRNETDPEFDRLLGRIVPWQEAMVSAGAERALLEAELSALAGAEWVTWLHGHAVLWIFPAMDRMVSDLEGTIKALGSR